MGVTPPAKVVVAATVGSEDAPEEISESGTAEGFVDASVKVSVGVERAEVAPEAALALATLVAALEAAEVTVVEPEAAAAFCAETRAGRTRAGRRARIMAGGVKNVGIRATSEGRAPLAGRRLVLSVDETDGEREAVGPPSVFCFWGLLGGTTPANSAPLAQTQFMP